MLSFRPQFLNLGDFPGGFHFRFHRIETELLRNGSGGAAVIAGEHDHFQPERMESLDRFGSSGFDRIGDG